MQWRRAPRWVRVLPARCWIPTIRIPSSRRGLRGPQALPGEFESKNEISGVNATDLFSLNSFLGSGIELEVVRTLNSLRQIWDPDSEWSTYRFERSAQAFPDVRLVNRGTEGEPLAIGIELKGWWMLAKEKVPSLRYQVSPMPAPTGTWCAACRGTSTAPSAACRWWPSRGSSPPSTPPSGATTGGPTSRRPMAVRSWSTRPTRRRTRRRLTA